MRLQTIAQRKFHSPLMHCFKEGDLVYLRWQHTTPGHPPITLHNYSGPFVVETLLSVKCWPHYELRDQNGGKWVASQLELSSKPIPTQS